MLKTTNTKKFAVGSQRQIQSAIIQQHAQGTNLEQAIGSFRLINFLTGYYPDDHYGFMEFQGLERQYYVQLSSKMSNHVVRPMWLVYISILISAIHRSRQSSICYILCWLSC